HLAIESVAVGFELGLTYAIQGRHALTASYTHFSHLPVKDDEEPRSEYSLAGQRNGIGYRYMTRRGTRLRPTLGVHFSRLSLEVVDSHDMADPLATTAESRFSFDPELGLLVQAPRHIVAHAALRPDFSSLAQGEGLTLMMFTIGAGAHF
ncbi:MAG TPA: hypothetical protein VML75_24175, partial [Kofleriaceae bacterium]|nr:hypothetical protein [Kofleriaceae bacterium]